jgi:thiol-disulfide isomerase/thioredoxin
MLNQRRLSPATVYRLAPRLLLAILLLSSFAAYAAPPDPLPSASDVMAQSRTQAAAEHKNILLVFSASWCGPCRRFELFLNDPAIKPIIDKTFVIARLDVGERADDPNHSNSPGATELRASLGGEKAGYPYIIMLDPEGNPIVASIIQGKNGKPGESIGYPDRGYQIDWFMEMLKKSAPSLSGRERDTIDKWLKARARA